METRRLTYFIAIVDAGSISKAASLLNMAQPALSQQLAILETELKVKLLDRGQQGVSMTAAGQRLYTQASPILREVNALQGRLARAAGGIGGVVSVGLPPTLAMTIGIPLMTRLAAHPDVILQVIETSAVRGLEDLRLGRLDLAIVTGPALAAEVDLDPLFEEPLQIAFAPHLDLAKASPAALADAPWVVTREPNAMRSALRAAFHRLGLEPHVAFEVDSFPLIIESVAHGLGLTLLPPASVRAAVAAGRIQTRPLSDEALTRKVALARAPGLAPSAAVQLVYDLIKAIARPT